jgi:hypothetical protein
MENDHRIKVKMLIYDLNRLVDKFANNSNYFSDGFLESFLSSR